MQIHIRISRFHPEKDKKPYVKSYGIEVDPNDRVLDAIEQVRDEVDSTLAYRRSCAHAVCGSCAMRINGRNALACKVLIIQVPNNTNNHRKIHLHSYTSHIYSGLVPNCLHQGFCFLQREVIFKSWLFFGLPQKFFYQNTTRLCLLCQMGEFFL